MKQKMLGSSGIPISAIGLGCMGMYEFYGETNDDESTKVVQCAAELGVTFFDTADTYGAGHNEILLANALGKASGKCIIATKFGISRKPGMYERRIDNSPQYIRQACEDCCSCSAGPFEWYFCPWRRTAASNSVASMLSKNLRMPTQVGDFFHCVPNNALRSYSLTFRKVSILRNDVAPDNTANNNPHNSGSN